MSKRSRRIVLEKSDDSDHVYDSKFEARKKDLM